MEGFVGKWSYVGESWDPMAVWGSDKGVLVFPFDKERASTDGGGLSVAKQTSCSQLHWASLSQYVLANIDFWGEPMEKQCIQPLKTQAGP